MALRYGYFDSEITGVDSEGMPIFDRAETSDFLAMFISRIISNGVLAAPADCFQVIAKERLIVSVKPGFAIINGRFAADDTSADLALYPADSAYPRIDRVVLRCNYLERRIELVVKMGTPGVTPVPPEIVQPTSGDYYELGLATVRLSANQTVITQSAIADTRYDSSVCGTVTQVIDHLDTEVFFAQLTSFYQEFVATCSNDYTEYTNTISTFISTLRTSGLSQLQDIVNQMNAFAATSEAAFNTWFEDVRGQLSDDVAGMLMNRTDDIRDGAIGISQGITVTFLDSGNIRTDFDDGRHKETVFNQDGSIETTMYDVNGLETWCQRLTFTGNAIRKERVENG